MRGEQAELDRILAAQKKACADELPVPLAVRRDRLTRLKAMLITHQDALIDAVTADFPTRPEELTLLTEIFMSVDAIDRALKQLPRWMKPVRKPAPLPFRLFGARAEIMHQPLGSVGIMAPWNAPLNLLTIPLTVAFAAGNRAMLLPSEGLPALSALLHRLAGESFAPEELYVAVGGIETAKIFSGLAFDHLMFTGSPGVARSVMAKAAENLVPVTLELGGKCPVLLLDDADLDDAARRLVFGKTINAGQACLAPDTIYVPRSHLDGFVDRFAKSFFAQYEKGVCEPGYCGIVNDRHQMRLQTIIEDARGKGAKVVTLDSAHRSGIMAPVLILDAPPDALCRKEELFGPVAQVLGYDSIDTVCRELRAGPKPLGLYVFSRNSRTARAVIERTCSGGVTVNDTLMHYTVPDLPFGGVGESGLGAYSAGIEGFRRFSHARAVYTQRGPFALTAAMRPPFGKLFDLTIRRPLRPRTRN